MERLPEQYGVVVQTPEEREELYGRDIGMRGTDLQGPQNGVVGLQSVFQSFIRGMYVV